MHLAIFVALALAAHLQVPPPLATLESVAEDIDDAVVSHDWAKVETLESKGDRALYALRTGSPGARRRVSQALADAEAAIQSRDAMATRYAANRLADAVVDLYEPFHPTVPTSVMRLDVLLRTVDLAAAAGHPAEARQAINRANAIWQDLAAKAPIAGSPVEAPFATELDAVERAAKADDFPALHKAAVAALDGVDTLEARFKTTH